MSLVQSEALSMTPEQHEQMQYHVSALGICGLIKSPFLREEAGSASFLPQKLGFYFLASP